MPKQTSLGVETLQRDAAALFSFVDSICAHCYQNTESPAYLEPSVRFFTYIQGLGDATKAYLNIFPANAPRNEGLYQDYRQKLEIIRLGWFFLHEFIKPAVDADTLNIPYTLVDALTRRLNLVHGFEKTTFAIFHSDALNYFEVQLSAISLITGKFGAVIPDPPLFPEGLGLIGIPYSQSSSLYLNSLISHEMGHFVFQKLELKQQLLPNIEEALGPQLQGMTPDDLTWSKDRLASWAEELFCDLFATWLIGPTYSLTYVEVFGLTTILDPAKPSGFSVTEGSSSFTRSHPADLFRLTQQVLLLQKLRWWDEVDAIKSHYIDVLRDAATVNDTDLKFRTDEKDEQHARQTLQAFLRLVPRLAELIAEVMKNSEGTNLDSGVDEYQKFGRLIGHYLGKAVVPSTVFDGKHHWYPDTVTLLNASMKFYLESIEELMNDIEGQKISLAGHRSRWIKRVESLTAKAIEDHHLLVTEKGAAKDGGSFKRGNLGPPEPPDQRSRLPRH